VEKWQKPRANDPEKRGLISDDRRNGIAGQAENWEAPSVAVTEGSRMTRGGARSGELLLTGQAMEAATKFARQWPAPAARDHKGVNSADHLTVSTGSCHLDQLPNFVEHVFHLPRASSSEAICRQQSSPAPAIAAGSTSSTASPNSNQPLVKRKLNPIFVEALMRWPTGLSGFERQETAWTQWWQLQRSYLLALDWGSSETEVQHDLFG